MSSVDTTIIPANETDRMRAVERYSVLDTPPDGTFDRITRLASAILDMPISIVSIVDHDRIWFKSGHGLDVDQIGRDPGLCASAILQDDVWVVENADVDPRALSNPLVAGEFGLRFYAGAPLRTSDGLNLGTLCVIDRKPRSLTPEQQQILNDLAALVVDELELRLAAIKVSRRGTELNDDVVQALAVAKLSLQVDQSEQALEHVDRALEASKRILGELADDAPSHERTTGALSSN